MFADFFDDVCVQKIIWEAATSRDQYGKPVYGGAPQTFDHGRRTYKFGRVAGFSKAVKGEGAEFVSESEIIILGTPTLGLGGGYEDRVYVDGDTIFPPIVSIENAVDETGAVQYTKVSLGNANG